MAYQCPKCGFTSDEDVISCPTCDDSTEDTEEEAEGSEENSEDDKGEDSSEKVDSGDSEE